MSLNRVENKHVFGIKFFFSFTCCYILRELSWDHTWLFRCVIPSLYCPFCPWHTWLSWCSGLCGTRIMSSSTCCPLYCWEFVILLNIRSCFTDLYDSYGPIRQLLYGSDKYVLVFLITNVPDQRRGRPQRRFVDVVKKDLGMVGVKAGEVGDRVRWRQMIGCGDPWS